MFFPPNLQLWRFGNNMILYIVLLPYDWPVGTITARLIYKYLDITSLWSYNTVLQIIIHKNFRIMLYIHLNSDFFFFFFFHFHTTHSLTRSCFQPQMNSLIHTTLCSRDRTLHVLINEAPFSCDKEQVLKHLTQVLISGTFCHRLDRSHTRFLNALNK